MMTPSNKVEPNIEDSSSSGGSFVHSMNLLSTAKGNGSSNDSRDSSGSDVSEVQLTKRGETSEVSDESDHENAKNGPPLEAATTNDTKASSTIVGLSSQPQAPKKLDASASLQHGFGGEFGSGEAESSEPYHDACTSVEALAEIAVEASARAASATMSDASGGANSVTAHVEPMGNSIHLAAVAKASASARQLSGGSSDQSVEHTLGSSISGDSSRSENASVLPTASALQTIRSAAVEPKAPLGHIHVKGKKHSSNSLPRYHPAPATIASLAPMPVVSAPGPVKSKPSSSLRRGKWTVEEEAYVARVIQDFNSGFLNAPAGTTLRSYLSEKLHCDPMRITKKFTGDACIGKRVFHPAVRCASNAAAIDKAQAELDALERRWRRRLEMQQRESAKKAAASVAAAVAAATGRSHSHLQRPHTRVGSSQIHGSVPSHQGSQHVQQNAVERTATWLDRANAILATQNEGQPAIPPRNVPSMVSSGPTQQPVVGVESLPSQEIQNQMRELQRLIHEGPVIQQTTAGLPHLLEQQHGQGSQLGSSSAGQRRASKEAIPQESTFVSSTVEPADKRPRTASTEVDNTDTSGAEDAEALVGFLNSVRASAEASGDAFSGP